MDVADMKPLHRKAAIVTCPKLHVEVCVGNAVYLTNHTDEPLTLKDGTTIAGFFKGKFWSDAAQKGKEDQNLEAGPSDVAFSLNQGVVGPGAVGVEADAAWKLGAGEAGRGPSRCHCRLPQHRGPADPG